PELSLGEALRSLGNLVSADGGRVSVVGKFLTSLGGAPPAVAAAATTLLASNNCLASLAGLEAFANLRTLSLACNALRYATDLRPLAALRRLEALRLEANPVCSMPNYRAHVLFLLPGGRLRSLDGAAVLPAEAAAAPAAVRTEAAAVDAVARGWARLAVLRHVAALFACHAELRRGVLWQRVAVIGSSCEVQSWGRAVPQEAKVLEVHAEVTIERMLDVFRFPSWAAFSADQLQVLRNRVLDDAATLYLSNGHRVGPPTAATAGTANTAAGTAAAAAASQAMERWSAAFAELQRHNGAEAARLVGECERLRQEEKDRLAAAPERAAALSSRGGHLGGSGGISFDGGGSSRSGGGGGAGQACWRGRAEGPHGGRLWGSSSPLRRSALGDGGSAHGGSPSRSPEVRRRRPDARGITVLNGGRGARADALAGLSRNSSSVRSVTAPAPAAAIAAAWRGHASVGEAPNDWRASSAAAPPRAAEDWHACRVRRQPANAAVPSRGDGSSGVETTAAAAAAGMRWASPLANAEAAARRNWSNSLRGCDEMTAWDGDAALGYDDEQPREPPPPLRQPPRPHVVMAAPAPLPPPPPLPARQRFCRAVAGEPPPSIAPVPPPGVAAAQAANSASPASRVDGHPAVGTAREMAAIADERAATEETAQPADLGAEEEAATRALLCQSRHAEQLLAVAEIANVAAEKNAAAALAATAMGFQQQV
ncbi:unnamed protein product, partial [Phaeothamnion confervicola]